MTLPSGSSMTVPLDPGSGGYKEIILSHDDVMQNDLVDVRITVKHMGWCQIFLRELKLVA